MKTLITVILVALLLPSLRAQQIDLAVIDVRVSSDNSNNIPVGLRSSVALEIQNVDSGIVEAGSSITIMCSVAGELLEASISLSSPLNPGMSLMHNFGDSNLVLFDDTNTNYLVSGAVSFAQDSNVANNVLESTYTTSTTINNDWSVNSFEVINPSNLDGFDVDNGTNIPPSISEVELVLQNDGDVTYLQWTPIRYRIYLGDDNYNISGALSNGDIEPGDSTLRHISNQAILPNTPDSIGEFSLCAEAREPLSANEAYCLTFEILDNFDPTDPTNWPQGVEDPTQNWTVRVYPESIQVAGISNTLEAMVYDQIGKMMWQGKLDANTPIATSTWPSGVYMMRMTDANGNSEVRKFIRP